MFFGRETNRILREKWADLNAFAQELWSLFQGDLPITQNAPVVLTQKGDTPPLVIRQPEGSDVPPIQIQRGSTTVSLGGFGDPTNPSVGGIDLGSLTLANPDPGIAAATPEPQDNPFVLYGQVVGAAGGNTYSVRVWAKPPDSSPAMGVITVRFPQVDPDDPLPNDFIPVLVLCFPGPGGTAARRTIVDAVAIAPVFVPRAS